MLLALSAQETADVYLQPSCKVSRKWRPYICSVKAGREQPMRSLAVNNRADFVFTSAQSQLSFPGLQPHRGRHSPTVLFSLPWPGLAEKLSTCPESHTMSLPDWGQRRALLEVLSHEPSQASGEKRCLSPSTVSQTDETKHLLREGPWLGGWPEKANSRNVAPGFWMIKAR